MDSSGVGAFIGAQTSVEKEGAKCKFFAAREQVIHVLKEVRVDKVLDLVEDEASALVGF